LTSLHLTQNNQYNLEEAKGRIDSLLQELSSIQQLKGNPGAELQDEETETGAGGAETIDISDFEVIPEE